MEPGIDYLKNSRGAFKTMFGLEKYLAQSGLDHKLMTLIKLRASQINDAPTALACIGRIAGRGRSEQRLYGLDAWRESPYYSERERAALGSAEAVTNIQQDHAPNEVFEQTHQHFSEKELADLTLTIATINAWN